MICRKTPVVRPASCQTLGVLPTPNRDTSSTRGGIWVVLAIVAAVVVMLGLVGGVLGWKFFRLDRMDDYRDGYAIGQKWRADGEQGECYRVMEAVYNQDAGARPEGWGAFVAGCQDGLAGHDEASWFELRHRLPSGD